MAQRGSSWTSLMWALAALATVARADDDAGGWTEKTKDGRVVQELKMEAPTFTEEDQYGYNMPERYRCDSCRAVMWHLDQDLRKVQPKSRRLKAWEYTDVFDATCRGGFEGYGIKLVNGENTLSGPGLKHNEVLNPGSGAIQMGGDSWSKRLGEICRKIVYEKVGEEEIYEKFYKKFHAEQTGEEVSSEAGLGEGLCTKELRECKVGPKPPPKAKEPEDKPEKAKSSKSKAKKDKAAKAKAKSETTPAPAARNTKKEKVCKARSKEPVNVETFLRNLAGRHDKKPEEYLDMRSEKDWETLMVTIAGRIFNKTPEGDTCKEEEA